MHGEMGTPENSNGSNSVRIAPIHVRKLAFSYVAGYCYCGRRAIQKTAKVFLPTALNTLAIPARAVLLCRPLKIPEGIFSRTKVSFS